MALYLLLLLGFALSTFGAFVLLRHSDRPGGTIKWLGAEVTSKGAGLPLIALGVGCIGFAAVRIPDDAVDRRNSRDSSANIVPAGPRGDTSCVAAWLRSVARDRIQSVEVGMQGVEVIGTHQQLDQPFALILTENGARIGAVRLRRYRGSNASTDLYKIEGAIDAACANVEDMRNASRGGNPRELINWDTFGATFGANAYELRIGGEGNITVGHFTRVAALTP